MSDHWNGLANLLGTPSLTPVNKKSDSPAKPVEKASTQPIAAQPKATEAEPPKPKSEPSRLRSSWDAVAQFFGVASPESVPESPGAEGPEAVSKVESSSAKSTKSDPKVRKKQSMWGPEPEVASAPAESKIAESPAEPQATSIDEEPIIGFSERPKRHPRGRDRDSRDRDSGLDREKRPVPASPEVSFESRESSDPERRSQRRPPRRGRGERLDDVVVTPSDDGVEASGDERRVDSRERDAEPSRDHRTARPDSTRNRRPARSESKDSRPDVDSDVERKASSRPERDSARDEGRSRSDRSRSERPPREERVRSERTDEQLPRPEVSRGERGDRKEGGRNRDSNRDDRSRGSRDRGEARHSEPRRESLPKDQKRSSGFGAGIHDEPEFIDNDDSLLEHDFDPIDSDLDPVDSPARSETDEEHAKKGRPKRRRGRGRGRRDEPIDSSSTARDRDVNEDRSSDRADGEGDGEEGGRRHAKIPSWQEAIGALVAVNMENHQRSQSPGRNSRGRGPRRDR